MTLVAEVRVTPISERTNMGEEVSRVVEGCEEAGLSPDVGPLATTFETDSLQDAIDAVGAAHRAATERSQRVQTTVTFHERLNQDEDAQSLVQDVER